MRGAFSSFVGEIATSDKTIQVLLGDIGVANFDRFKEMSPSNINNLGIMEQSMVGIGAGLAREGLYPVLHTITPFLIERAFEQIKVDFSYNKLQGLFVSVGGSFDYSKLGATHHCVNDINFLSSLEGFDLYLPNSKEEVETSLQEIFENRSLAYLRIASIEQSLTKNAKLGLNLLKNRGLVNIIFTGSSISNFSTNILRLPGNFYYINKISSDLDFSIFDFSLPTIFIEEFLEGTTRFALENYGIIFNQKVFNIGLKTSMLREYGTRSEIVRHYNLDEESVTLRINHILHGLK
jgi:transketolase